MHLLSVFFCFSNDTHESPTFQDQKAMSLFYCPVKGFMKTFLRSSTLQHYMIINEHVIQSTKETIYTPNANMADHSVGARDESNESEASEALMFCFDNAFPGKSCFVVE